MSGNGIKQIMTFLRTQMQSDTHKHGQSKLNEFNIISQLHI